ncbi:MAG: RNA methyltransferase [Siculibacillus sp.]|nr:RNA methyltransferase [Siculibacillus sp.]
MPTFVAIDDPDDPRIAPFRDVRERDLVGRDGLFVAEGAVVLAVLAASTRHCALSLLLDERRVGGLADVLARLPPETPVNVAGRAVIDAVAGFPLHRGILALGRRETPIEAEALLGRLGVRATVVVACGIANHDNMGGIFRNAAAFAADAVILDAECCDPFYRKAIRVSVGHVLNLPQARLGRGVDVVELLVRHGFDVLSLTPSAAERLVDVVPARRTALLLGTEGPGLSPSVLARSRPVAIPMAAGVDSLNVAVTSGIVLHHLASMRDRGDRSA